MRPSPSRGGRNSDATFELYKDRHTRAMPFSRLIATAGKAACDNDAYMTACNSAANRAALAPLIRDLGRLPFLNDGEGMLWIEPAGTFAPLHYDPTNNLLVQIVGRKLVSPVPPDEVHRLAKTRHVFSDVHDLTDPTCLAR